MLYRPQQSADEAPVVYMQQCVRLGLYRWLWVILDSIIDDVPIASVLQAASGSGLCGECFFCAACMQMRHQNNSERHL